MISDLSPRELKEFRDHLMKIGQGLTRGQEDEALWRPQPVHY